MGDVIKVLDKIKFSRKGGGEFDVELNRPSNSQVCPQRAIHIQSPSFRLEIREDEFLQIASCVLLAKKQLDLLKGGKQCQG